MVEIFSVCGKWKRNDMLQWEFLVDTNRWGSLCEVDENVTYRELVEMAIEDFGLGCTVESGDIILSYGLPSRMKSMVDNPPPVYIRNDRQVRSFINRIKEEDELIRLCVTVNDMIQSKTIRNEENCDVEKAGRTHVLETLDGLAYVDESNVHEKQQELHGATRSDMSAHVTHNDTCSTTENESLPLILHPAPDLSPVSFGCSHSTRMISGLYVNKQFKDKQELMLNMRKWALEWNFEFKSLWSNKSRVILGCVDDKCSWRMRATKLVSSDSFVVKKYVHEHTCDTEHRKASHRQATAKLLGSLICNSYGEQKDELKPKQIIEHVRNEHGLQIEYKKAWRVKEHALNLSRGALDSVTEVLSAPPTRKSSKRPSKKRNQSVGECGVPSSKSQKRKCSRCDREGHNKSTCKIPL